MAVTSRVQAIFTANASGLSSGTKRAAAALEELRGSVGRLQSGMSALVAIDGSRLFGSIVQYALRGVRAMIDLEQSTAKTIDRIAKLARQTGQTYAEFASLTHAGTMAGVGMDEIAVAINRMDRVFVDAQRGARTAQDAFAAIGLSVDELVGMTTAERFEAIVDAIAALPDPAQQAAAAMVLFGRSGANLLPLFLNGAAGIQQARLEMQRFGGALTNTQSGNVEAMNDAWVKVRAAVQSVVNQVVANLSPAIKAAFDTLTEFISKAGGVSIGASIAEAIFDGAELLASSADWVWQQLTAAWDYASSVIEQFGGVTAMLSRAAAVLKAVFSTGEAVFRSVAAFQLRVLSGYSQIAALLPQSVVGDGWVQFAQELNNQAREMAQQADRAAANAVASGWAALTGDMGDALGEAIERPTGVLESWVGRMRNAAADAANATGDAAARSVLAAGIEASALISAASKSVSAVDARSTAGVNQIVAAINGMGNTNYQRQELQEARTQTRLLEEIARREEILVEVDI